MQHALPTDMSTAVLPLLEHASSAATPALAPARSSMPRCSNRSGCGPGYGGGCISAGRAVITGALVLAACRTAQPAHAFAFSSPAAGRSSIITLGLESSDIAKGSSLGLRLASSTRTGDAWIVGSMKPVSLGRRKRRRTGVGSGIGLGCMSTSLEAGLGDMFKVPDERIIKAVEKAGNRAVPSDVAALAGVDLSVAKKGLVNLANIVGGDLEVSREGDVVYSFPTNIRASLFQKSAFRRLAEAFRGSWSVIFYGIRVSFGVALLVSVALIFATIFFVVASTNSSSDDERNNRRGGGFRGGMGRPMMGGGFDLFFGPSPLDLFFYRPYYGYYNTPALDRGYDKPEEMGLLEAIFSYIFGDGDPNRGIEQRRIEAAAKLIRENGGAVCAEQLAPLLCPDKPPSDDNSGGVVDEAFILPILTALDGAPEVTEDGDIVYVFPTLQTSAISGTGAGAGAGSAPSSRFRDTTAVASPLMEAERPFSVATTWKTVVAGILGAVNLGGALYLQGLLSQPALAGVTLPGYYGLVQGAMPFLVTYAVALNAIPAVRWLLNKRENAAIEKRNELRWQWGARARGGADRVVERKLRAARAMTRDLKVIKKGDVEYTTAKSLAEQKSSKSEDDILDDFDTRLKKNTNSNNT